MQPRGTSGKKGNIGLFYLGYRHIQNIGGGRGLIGAPGLHKEVCIPTVTKITSNSRPVPGTQTGEGHRSTSVVEDVSGVACVRDSPTRYNLLRVVNVWGAVTGRRDCSRPMRTHKLKAIFCEHRCLFFYPQRTGTRDALDAWRMNTALHLRSRSVPSVSCRIHAPGISFHTLQA